jgi:hypothetical protein
MSVENTHTLNVLGVAKLFQRLQIIEKYIGPSDHIVRIKKYY